MKKKHISTWRHIFMGVCVMLCAVPFMMSCNNEDDVAEIFTGKVWKLNRLNQSGTSGQFLSGLWDNEASYNSSMNSFYATDNYVIEFTLSGTNDSGGTFEARGIRATVTGTWNADGESHTLTLSPKVNSSETDPLAREFIRGLQQVTRYEGDSGSLVIYYKGGEADYLMGFTPR